MGFSGHQLLLHCSFIVLALGKSWAVGECPAPCRCLGDLVDCTRLKLSRLPEPLPVWTVQL